VESERESVQKTAEALEAAKRDVAARDRRIESLRSELERAQQAREDEKERKERKEEQKKKEKQSEPKEKKKLAEEVEIDEDGFEIKRRKSKKLESIVETDETVNAEWEDVALDVVKKVQAAAPKEAVMEEKQPEERKEKKEKKHSEAKEKKPKKKELDVEAISSHTMREEKRKEEKEAKSHLHLDRERLVEKMFASSPSKPVLQVERPKEKEKEPAKKALVPQRSQLLSPLRAAAQAAQREQETRAIGKKGNKRHSDEAENAPAPASKLPRGSPLTKVPGSTTPVRLRFYLAYSPSPQMYNQPPLQSQRSASC